MQLSHVTLVDPTLPHQVIFYVTSNSKMQIQVSCNCLTYRHPENGTLVHESMGGSHDLDTARELYNNPRNHELPFGQEDFAKW